MAERLTGLDALRGIAALLVLGFHLDTVFGGFSLFARSYLAVDFFFMLSGFVMARTYEPKFADGLGSLQFFKVRFIRLWPPMAVGTAVGVAVFVWLGVEPLYVAGATVAGLFFVPLPSIRMFPLNGPTWSITFELLANALHGAILWRLSSRLLLVVAGAALVALSTYCLSRETILVGNDGGDLVGGVPRVLLAYTIGIVLCRSGVSWDGPMLPALTIFAAALLSVPTGVPYDLAFVVVVCPAIILLSNKPGNSKVAMFLGGLSFPLYAVHYPILQASKLAGIPPLGAAAIAVAAAVLVGALVDRRLLRNRVKGGRAVQHVELGSKPVL